MEGLVSNRLSSSVLPLQGSSTPIEDWVIDQDDKIVGVSTIPRKAGMPTTSLSLPEVQDRVRHRLIGSI